MSKRSNSGAPPAPPITFYVRCEVDARGPLKHITTETPLYEFQEFEVKLTNPFEVTKLHLCLAFVHTVVLEMCPRSVTLLISAKEIAIWTWSSMDPH